MLRAHNELEFYEAEIATDDYLPPVRQQRIYIIDDGDFPGIPIVISIAAHESIDDEEIEAFTNQLHVFFTIFAVSEDAPTAEQEELVALLQQAADFLANTWDPAPYPAGHIAHYVSQARELAEKWAWGVEDVLEEDPVPDTDNTIFVTFQVDPEYQNEIQRPYELIFHFDPPISRDRIQSYNAPGSTDVLTTVTVTDGGPVAPDITGDALRMGDLKASLGSPVNLRSSFANARLYVRGDSPRSYYSVTGRIRVD